MAKTVLRVRLDGVAFYMNTETSSPSTGHRNRYRLFKTENYGRDKSGWIQVARRLARSCWQLKMKAPC